MIGDPSFKSDMRKLLTKEEVDKAYNELKEAYEAVKEICRCYE